jgi:dTDP-glucose 4,6-dehydratase
MIMRKLKNLMVTGGCGFIGSNFIRYLFQKTDFKGNIINVDILTYAGNPENLADIDELYGRSRYFFEHASICDYENMVKLFSRYNIDTVVHFAAESHVDRSIYGPKDFITTNIVGTFTLLEAARSAWKGKDGVLFYHISTDEVFGSLGKKGYFTEETPYDPRSPYSASKASADHLVRAAYHTYGLPVALSNCSNNFGPYQFPEKLIPLIILNILENKELPVYGDGKNIRDWLYVEDHVAAVWLILQKGMTGETYNIGGHNEWQNIDLVHLICERVATLQGKDKDMYKKKVTYVKDRPGHDRRYAIDCSKLKKNLNWSPAGNFLEELDHTIEWYMENREWVDHIKTGEYIEWIEKNYGKRT